MTQKVYVTSKQMATISCPQCNRSKTVDVSKYATLDKMVRINVKCPCGHAYKAILEKRKQYRKETNLAGTFIHFINGQPQTRGLMTVKDLSTSGVKLQLNVKQNFAIGDHMQIEFHLNDAINGSSLSVPNLRLLNPLTKLWVSIFSVDQVFAYLKNTSKHSSCCQELNPYEK
jgi:hypothetical protein